MLGGCINALGIKYEKGLWQEVEEVKGVVGRTARESTKVVGPYTATLVEKVPPFGDELGGPRKFFVNPEIERFWAIDYRIFDPDIDGKSKLDHVNDMLGDFLHQRYIVFQDSDGSVCDKESNATNRGNG